MSKSRCRLKAGTLKFRFDSLNALIMKSDKNSKNDSYVINFKIKNFKIIFMCNTM